MITALNRENVYIGFDLQEFNRIREILEANQIDYAQKVNNHAGSWALEGTIRGRAGKFWSEYRTSSTNMKYMCIKRTIKRQNI